MWAPLSHLVSKSFKFDLLGPLFKLFLNGFQDPIFRFTKECGRLLRAFGSNLPCKGFKSDVKYECFDYMGSRGPPGGSRSTVKYNIYFKKHVFCDTYELLVRASSHHLMIIIENIDVKYECFDYIGYRKPPR